MAKKTTAKTGALVPQPHGGAIRNGGPNSGGPGRPPTSLRSVCRGRFDKLLPQLDKILNKKSLKDADFIAIMNLFARYGADPAMPIPELRQRLERQNDVIRGLLPSDDAERVIQGVGGVWVG